jgi:putative transposase
MRDLILMAVHLVVTLAKLARPGGVRSVMAESLLLKQHLLISRRSRRRAPSLTTIDRFVLRLLMLFVRPGRVAKVAAVLKPATLLRFHKALVDAKYRRLFSSAGAQRRPGPKGPTQEIISAIIEMKLRNYRFGYQRIAQQISHAFGVQIDKDVARRVLSAHDRPDHPHHSGPSWLTFFAQAKDCLWSVDLFRCESVLLRSHWVIVVTDLFTRHIVGFGIGGEYIDGPSVYRMFNQAIAGNAPPARISTDHDPLFRFHRWLANLRVLELEEIKSVPCAPMSHPFIERLIGTIGANIWTKRSSGIRSIFTGSSKNSERITTALASTAPSTAPRPQSVPDTRHRPLQTWHTMRGNATATDYSKLPSRHESVIRLQQA